MIAADDRSSISSKEGGTIRLPAWCASSGEIRELEGAFGELGVFGFLHGRFGVGAEGH